MGFGLLPLIERRLYRGRHAKIRSDETDGDPMGELVVQLIPVALGIVLSPLAIMALVAVLLSEHARANGVAYLLGWAVGVAGLLALFLWLFPVLNVRPLPEPPVWTSLLRLVFALILIGGAIWVYRRGAARIRQMAAASTPQEVAAAAPALPGWLQSVATFRPIRCFFLGVGLFVVNPVDASCAILAALDLTLADITDAQRTGTAIVFAIIGILPIAIPVLFVVVRGSAAQPALDRVRGWIAGNTHVLNAALLLVIGALQLEKAITGLL